jgi:selenide,water dikinase
MPIVDDAYDFGPHCLGQCHFGRVRHGRAALLAIAVLGWPVDKLPPEVARRVLEGARSICAEAGIPLAGGPQHRFARAHFRAGRDGHGQHHRPQAEHTATAGSELFLTKPLGVGILTTAQKKGISARRRC